MNKTMYLLRSGDYYDRGSEMLLGVYSTRELLDWYLINNLIKIERAFFKDCGSFRISALSVDGFNIVERLSKINKTAYECKARFYPDFAIQYVRPMLEDGEVFLPNSYAMYEFELDRVDWSIYHGRADSVYINSIVFIDKDAAVSEITHPLVIRYQTYKPIVEYLTHD